MDQVSLLNRVVNIDFTEKEPRLESGVGPRLLRVSVSDIRNWKCESPTAKAYLLSREARIAEAE